MDRRQFIRLMGTGLISTWLPTIVWAAQDASGPDVKVWEGRMTEGEVDVEVHMDMYQFEFDPSTIQVHQNQRIRIYLRSKDVTHGIRIDGYPIKIDVRPGQVKTLEFTATRAGSFRFRCSHACGYFHPFMIGKLTVKPNRRFNVSLAGSALVGLGVFGWLWWTKGRSKEREE